MLADRIKNFRFWCHKVLPLTYDNSLSYYELLCKVHKLINDIIEVMKEIEQIVEELNQRVDELNERVDLLDEKVTLLESKIVEIENRINEIVSILNTHTELIERLREDVTNIQNQIGAINNQLVTINTNLTNLTNEVNSLKARVLALENSLSDMNNRLNNLESRVSAVEEKTNLVHISDEFVADDSIEYFRKEVFRVGSMVYGTFRFGNYVGTEQIKISVGNAPKPNGGNFFTFRENPVGTTDFSHLIDAGFWSAYWERVGDDGWTIIVPDNVRTQMLENPGCTVQVQFTYVTIH